MKISLTTPKSHFNIRLPMFFIKSRIFLKVVGAGISRKAIKIFYKELKKQVKRNGHFKLIEILTASGEEIEIVI